MDIDDFESFIHSFDDEYLIPVSEISRSHTGTMDQLVSNPIPMYSLDDICKHSPKLSENLPKTTDALYYRIDDGRLVLFLIEFKFFNMDGSDSNYVLLDAMSKNLKSKNRARDEFSEKCISDTMLKKFENIKEDFVDNVEVSLRLKPYETLMVALPMLYEEYSQKSGASKEFRMFLEDVEVQLYVFVNKVSQIKNVSSQRAFPHSIRNALKHQYFRLKSAEIINFWNIKEAGKFDSFVNKKITS
jgi:hypothetical protein